MSKNYKLTFLLMSSLLFWGCGGIKKQTQVGTPPNVQSLRNIPSVCKDPHGNYKPVKNILSKARYNQKASPYPPIIDPKGFIAERINNDKIKDYIFIERAEKNIRLITCVSIKNKLKRNITPFKIHETVKPDFQTISESIQYQSKVLILMIEKDEHNWGSDREINSYTYNNTRNDFKLEAQERTSFSGDGLRSNTFEFYDLKNQRYKTMSTCGRLEEGCKPHNSSGQIILAKEKPILLKPGKLYQGLRPD